MRLASDNLEEFLGSVLRGVSKIVGCNSTNLVIINETAREMRVRIGATADSYPDLAKFEALLGVSFRGLTVPIEAAANSLISKVWRGGASRETSELSEMIGSALDAQVIEQFQQMAGERRYLVAPAASTHRRYGVMIFEKTGRDPFTRQQREVLLRYARRIGVILENDMMGHGLRLGPSASNSPECLLIDENGQLAGRCPGDDELPALIRSTIGDEVRAWLGDPQTHACPAGSLPDGRRVQCKRFELDGRPAALCWLETALGGSEGSLENQLLQLTMGEAAPALFTDRDFRITSTNQAADKLFGNLPEALIGRSIDALFSEPASLTAHIDPQSVLPGGPVTEIPVIAERADGGSVPARVEALMLADNKDQGLGYLLLLREMDPAAGPHDTERLIEQERMATMGEMAAQLAHEIRNPLVAIGATLEGLSKDASDERQRGLLQSVNHEIKRMDMILRQYLSGRHDLTFVPVALEELLTAVRRLFEGARRKHGKSLSLQVDAQVVVRADYDSLKHVFFNLILNALEASPSGGEVVCRTELRPQAVAVHVEDRGAGLGMPAERCLNPFFTTKSNGTGLGLPVCARLIQAHGGFFELCDRNRGGCRATVVLPMKSAVGETRSTTH
jgi:PAS domain S-box-containing protein